MKDFSGRVAVVTGAASGMGLAFAHRFAEEGMDVVLADIESEPLAMAEAAVAAKGVKALAVRTDVMDPPSIGRLADAAFKTFGNVHILCNNAGVAAGAQPSWESRLEDWEWVLGVNFWGVLHGIRAFLPRMLENGDEGHVVNTASMAGLLPGGSAYSVSKHAVVSLSEGLYTDLQARGAKVSASVLCPGWVNTNILTSQRNRQEEFGAPLDDGSLSPEQQARFAIVSGLIRNGYAPEEVAQQVLEAVREERFWILPTQAQFIDLMKARFDGVLEQRNPAPPAAV